MQNNVPITVQIIYPESDTFGGLIRTYGRTDKVAHINSPIEKKIILSNPILKKIPLYDKVGQSSSQKLFKNKKK